MADIEYEWLRTGTMRRSLAVARSLPDANLQFPVPNVYPTQRPERSLQLAAKNVPLADATAIEAACNDPYGSPWQDTYAEGPWFRADAATGQVSIKARDLQTYTGHPEGCNVVHKEGLEVVDVTVNLLVP